MRRERQDEVHKYIKELVKEEVNMRHNFQIKKKEEEFKMNFDIYNSKRLNQPMLYNTVQRSFKIPEISRSYKNSRSPLRNKKLTKKNFHFKSKLKPNLF